MCVQRFDDSLNSAIRITYRISLRSSSMPEPRDPLLKVLKLICGKSHSEDTPRSRGKYSGLGGPRRAPVSGAPPPAPFWEERGCARGVSAEATVVCSQWVWEFLHSVMIPPLVHQRRPCYDFYFL
jgi:hypothetical protein